MVWLESVTCAFWFPSRLSVRAAPSSPPFKWGSGEWIWASSYADRRTRYGVRTCRLVRRWEAQLSVAAMGMACRGRSPTTAGGEAPPFRATPPTAASHESRPRMGADAPCASEVTCVEAMPYFVGSVSSARMAQVARRSAPHRSKPRCICSACLPNSPWCCVRSLMQAVSRVARPFAETQLAVCTTSRWQWQRNGQGWDFWVSPRRLYSACAPPTTSPPATH